MTRTALTNALNLPVTRHAKRNLFSVRLWNGKGLETSAADVAAQVKALGATVITAYDSVTNTDGRRIGALVEFRF